MTMSDYRAALPGPGGVFDSPDYKTHMQQEQTIRQTNIDLQPNTLRTDQKLHMAFFDITP